MLGWDTEMELLIVMVKPRIATKSSLAYLSLVMDGKVAIWEWQVCKEQVKIENEHFHSFLVYKSNITI